jgi:transposase InsO family protein
MTAREERQRLTGLIEQAREQGARLSAACREAGLTARTWQRWRDEAGQVKADARPQAERPAHAHALTPAERERVVAVANAPRFADLPPAQIVPRLADEGVYLASESTFHRVLRDAGQNAHRGRARRPQPRRPPTTHLATAPCQVWCWDVTWLPSTVAGRWYYLFLIVDLYSRKVVGYEVHAEESGEHAADLLKRAALAEGLHGRAIQPVLHGDNGAALKATTVLAMLRWLGIAPSYSRPRVSNDNAYVESLFRTAKYRPGFPAGGFADQEAARQWAMRFVGWYNTEHRHSGIRFVTPAQRHQGNDIAVLEKRHALYQQARHQNPRRWSQHTRNWTPIRRVALNPERESIAAKIAA